VPIHPLHGVAVGRRLCRNKGMCRAGEVFDGRVIGARLSHWDELHRETPRPTTSRTCPAL